MNKLLRVNIKTNEERIILLPISDTHIGNKAFDKDLFEEVLEWAYKNKNVYILGMGDLIDCNTKDSPGSSLIDQQEGINEQIESIISYLRPFSDEGRLIGLISGNHSRDRLYRYCGLDIDKMIADILEVPYLGNSSNIRILVNKQAYDIYATHGNSCSTTVQGKLGACMKLANFNEAEIFLHAHVHDVISYKSIYKRQNTRNKTIEEVPRYFILTGSYLKYFDSYGEQKNYAPLARGTPKIKLHAKEHNIRVSI